MRVVSCRVAQSLHLAQASYARAHNGSFATKVSSLLNATLCNLDLGTSDTCDLDALQYAASHPRVFALTLSVTANISAITRACPTRPCYMASVRVSVPPQPDGEAGSDGGAAPYVYTATINNNRDTQCHHAQPTRTAPCL